MQAHADPAPVGVRLIFREVNERLRALAETFASNDAWIEVVCECDRNECLGRIRMSREAYDRLRSNPAYFVLGTKHDPPAGRVVERGDGYIVVDPGENGAP